MHDYPTVLAAAQALPAADRVRLIEALSVDVEAAVTMPLSADWLDEIDRRSNEIDAGTVELEDWSDIRTRWRRSVGLPDED